MELAMLIILIMFAIAGFSIFISGGGLVEGMTGYGTMSGLAFNSKPLYCFKNIYDPPNADGTEFGGYCSIIGKVVV